MKSMRHPVVSVFCRKGVGHPTRQVDIAQQDTF
jgi:hypothetical protein